MLNTSAKTLRRPENRSGKVVDSAKINQMRPLSAEETKLVSGGLFAPGEPLSPYRPVKGGPDPRTM